MRDGEKKTLEREDIQKRQEYQVEEGLGVQIRKNVQEMTINFGNIVQIINLTEMSICTILKMWFNTFGNL